MGAVYLSPEKIRETGRQIQARTKKPFLINLFVPNLIPKVSDEQVRAAVRATRSLRDELHLSEPKFTPPYEEDFDQQFEATLSLKSAVFSFVFGTLRREYIKALRDIGTYVIGTGTTPSEAMLLDSAGVDAIVLQGVESGGHRGIFDPESDDPNISVSDLMRAVKGKVECSLIAAGGIMTRDDVKAALSAGADAVQMGTAFLAVKEAGTSSPYRRKLLESETRTTRLTRAFSGRLARGLVNRIMEKLDLEPKAILPFPAQNKFTRDLRAASAAKDMPDFISLWCGTGQGQLWTGSAADLIGNLLGW